MIKIEGYKIMWDITYNLSKLVPPAKNGYRYIKSVNLFIPYREIGISALIRSKQELPFFYEVIMKLIDCGSNEIFRISEFTGVEEEILNDVIGEMSRLDLVYVKGNILTLTIKGKETLNKLVQTVIEKEVINKIYVNTITGKITELNKIYNKPFFKSPALDDAIKITDQFINNNLSEFNEYYQKRQEEFEFSDSNLNNKKEIYQIIGREYERLCYDYIKVFIYENIRDKDLVYQCENSDDSIYTTAFSKQINSSPAARNFLVNPRYHMDHLNEKYVINKELQQNAENLIRFIENTENDNIEECYFSNRYLLENEYVHILTTLKNVKPDEIIISSPLLKDMLSDEVIAALHSRLDSSELSIICNSKENNIKQLKTRFFKYTKKEKNKVQWLEKENITQTNIILYPKCAITIDYVPISVGNDCLIQEISEITFDKEKVLDKYDCIKTNIPSSTKMIES